MLRRLNYIVLMIISFVAHAVAGEPHVVDKVCKDAVRTYRVDQGNGEPVVSYNWILTDASGNPVSIPSGAKFTDTDSNGNPVEGSEIQINWSFNPGIYTLAVEKQSQYGCAIDTAGTIELVPNPEVFAGDDLPVCGGSKILLDKATASYSSKLEWTTDGDGTFNDSSVLQAVYTPGPADKIAGSVTLRITAEGLGDEGSCIPVTDVVKLSIIYIQATVNSTRVTCFDANDGTITIYDDGLAAYQYNVQLLEAAANWTNSYFTENLAPGKYLVQISNPLINSCAVTLDTVEVIEPEPLTATIDETQPNCFGKNGAITVTDPKGGWGSYQYRLNDMPWQSSGSFPNVGAITYDVQIRDASFPNCVVPLGSVTIVDPPELTATVTPTPVKCPGTNSGSIVVENAAGGSWNFEFSKDGTNWQGSPIFSNLPAGDYPVSMRDASHPECVEFLEDIILDDPPPIVASLTPFDATCYDTPDGKIQVSPPSNGTPPYEYSKDRINWQTDALITGLAGDKNYTVWVRDANKCVSEVGTKRISQPDKLDFISVTTDETVANAKDGSITITAQAGGSKEFQYKFDGLGWQDDPTISSLAPGPYMVYMRDKLAPSCEISKQVTIYPAGSVTAEFIFKNITCSGGNDGQITFTNLSGAANYSFSIDDGANWQNDNPVFTGLVAGTYILKVKDQGNEANVKRIGQIELTQPKEISATVVATPESAAGANDGKLTITNPKGGSETGYQYSLDNVNWFTKTVFSGLTSGSYTVYIKDSNNCPGQVPKTISIMGQLIADVTHTDVLCKGDNNGSITISNPSGASFYEYNIGNGWNPIIGESITISGLAPKPTPYTVMIRDRFNQSNEKTLEPVTITEPLKLTGRFTIEQEPLCAGGSGFVSVFATGGTGVKTFTNALTGTVISNLTFAVAAGGNMTVIVTDENGCFYPFNISMKNPLPIVVSEKRNPPMCFGESGSVDITASGGTGDLFVNGLKMTGGKMSFTVPSGRLYNYVVTDSNGCPSMPISGTMPNAPAQLAISFTGLKDVSCFGGNDGAVTAVVSGGTPPYKYQWSDPAKQTTAIAVGLRKGTYKVTVTDANDCPMDAEVTINEQPALVKPTASVTQPDCETSIGTITVNTPVPTAGITYTVTGTNPVVAPVTNTTGVFTGLMPGVYNYTVTNAFGCTTAPISEIINSHLRTPANPTALPVPPACEDVPVQTLIANNYIVPPPAGVSIVWYDAPVGGNVIASPTLNTPTTVTYYAEAANGECTSKGRTPVTLTIIPRPAAPVSLGDLSDCESTPMVTLDARDAILPSSIINLKWYDALTGGNPVAAPVLNSVRSVTYYAENAGGICSSSPRIPVTLTIYSLPAKPTAVVSVVPRCIDSSGEIEVKAPLGSNYMYSIDNGPYQSSVTFINQTPGDHSIRVKNTITTCESGATVLKVPDIPPVPHIISLIPENCICYGDSGKLNFEFANVVDGTYVIVYVGGQFNNVKVVNGKASILAPAGVYNVLAIEANGCTSSENWNVEIKQPDQISVSATITEIDLKSNQKGEINLTISGGTGSYQTIWMPNLSSGFMGATTEDIKNLNAGIYTVTVTDANGCQKQYIDTIPKANLPPIATDDEFTTNCSGVSGNLVYNDNGSGIDSDPDGDLISIDTTPIGTPLHGFLTINADGTFEYKAVQGYTGDDSFRYTIYDVKKNYSIPATVTIHVVSDFDGDGIADNLDPDADADGILNVDEALSGQDWKITDSDGESHPNWLDIDSDNDGIVDNIEAQSSPGYVAPLLLDTDNDGLDDAYDTDQLGKTIVPVDTDGDGISDFLDSDSDNDLVSDYIEGHDQNSDGRPDHVSVGKDSDGDGLDDGYDIFTNICTISENIIGSNAAMQDFDGDGMKDWRDENDDDDEYLTRFEDLNMDGDFSNDDTDFDGHPEYLDYGRDCDLFIPNAFSPNNDNIHDYFQIYCIDHFPNAKIYIFDQLGNLLYQQEHYGNLEFWKAPERAWWDGRTKNRAVSLTGGKVPIGTYYYVLNLGNGDVRKSFVFISY